LLCDEVQKYINSVAPTSNLRGYAIVEECEKYNVDIKFVLAQGEIESHFATKGLGGKLNSVFNVGIFDEYTEKDIYSNYKYDHPNQSIRPYLELLTTRYLVNKLEEDLMYNYVDVNGNRYASDTNYESKLRDKHTYITMHTKIDELQKQLHNYAIKCNRL
jgi:flagellum-specific peptidoglycan hydrolase FlgJ